jgi:lipoyl(octanoyl) transferase 2
MHLRLPGVTSYHHAGRIQQSLIDQHFRSKDLWRAVNAPDTGASPAIPPPDPTIITAEFQPVYTFGRRQLNSVSGEQRRYLEDNGKAIVVEAQRGGQVTYHGPGQLVAYPIINLRRHKITPREYVRVLEETVMSVCSAFGVPNVETTADPGVWIKGGQRKICALGVQVRRGITAHGIGLNVYDRDESLSWGFSRIVACGLEGKEVTWLSNERLVRDTQLDIGSVASKFVEKLALRLGDISNVYDAPEQSLQDELGAASASAPANIAVTEG